MQSRSVIVVGAGIVGCTVAYELARSGASVHVIETRAPGQGATRASAGILAPFIEGHGSTLLRGLGKRSLDLYDPFIAQLRRDSNHPLIYRRNGTFELAFSTADVTRLGELASLLADRGVGGSWIEPPQFPNYEPAASPAALGALLIPSHGFVGVTSLTLAAAAAAENFGARFTMETGAIRIVPIDDGRVGVHTPQLKLDADRVVLAAGSWSSQITVEGVDAIPVTPIRGQLIQLQADAGAIERVVWDLTATSCRGPTDQCWSGPRSRMWASMNPTPPTQCNACTRLPPGWCHGWLPPKSAAYTRACGRRAPMTCPSSGVRG